MAEEVTRDDASYAGQAVYTPGFLRIYDLYVLRGNGLLAWRCGPGRLVRMYNEHVSGRHLDIGVGTGYFLDHCRFPVGQPQITLMDLNPNSIEAAAQRIARYTPMRYVGNALEDFGEVPGAPFESIGMNWLLHCVPGDIASKSVIFDHCKAVLAPGGVVFGSTVLNGGVRHTPWSRAVQQMLNKRGVFSNLQDDLDGLRRELGARFDSPRVDVVGTVGIFSARA